jgi:nitroreductase/dihydropteridine reductase
MELKEIMQWRYATKVFDPNKPVDDALIHKILDITNLSASSHGMQPFKMILIKDQEMKKKLKAISNEQENVENSSHLIIFAARTDLNEAFVDECANRVSEIRNVSLDSLEGYKKMLLNALTSKDQDQQFKWASNQVYLALGTFLIACAAEKVDACPIGGFSPDKFDEFLDLKKYNLRSVVVGLAGYRHESDKYQHRAKVRKSLNTMIIEL